MCYNNDARPPMPPEKRGKAHGEDIVIYPDAPHSFFNRRVVAYADASADA